MKISYDAEVDALSITFRKTTVTTKHLAEGIVADYDKDGRLAASVLRCWQIRLGWGSNWEMRKSLKAQG